MRKTMQVLYYIHTQWGRLTIKPTHGFCSFMGNPLEMRNDDTLCSCPLSCWWCMQKLWPHVVFAVLVVLKKKFLFYIISFESSEGKHMGMNRLRFWLFEINAGNSIDGIDTYPYKCIFFLLWFKWSGAHWLTTGPSHTIRSGSCWLWCGFDCVLLTTLSSVLRLVRRHSQSVILCV